MREGTAVIIGAGPAGLTAAFELLERTRIVPTILEKSDAIGGISRTIDYRGNRIDIGGHRFFSKSDRVMAWWLDRLPLEAREDLGADRSVTLGYQNQRRDLEAPSRGPSAAEVDRVMLLRERRSRIFYLRRFFDYPLSLSAQTVMNLGVLRTARIGVSYAKAVVAPRAEERTLEDFFVNRFGEELYRTFFKDYTEKVWGTACRNISAEWGAQRIKGLNVTKALVSAAKRMVRRGGGGLEQRDTETSLIERFLYPKFGPGQMWEEVARQVEARGGTITRGRTVTRIEVDGERIRAVHATDSATGESLRYEGDHFFSTMPVRELVAALDAPVPAFARTIAEGLVYRDFFTVGLLLSDIDLKERDGGEERVVRDNWIYVQEPDVHVGRLQIFNNWSPWMVSDPSKIWVGLEYFCNEGDALWSRSDAELVALAEDELVRLGIARRGSVLDAVVVRQEKTYPAYFGTYDRFDELRAYLDRFSNLFLIGRNGMHKYNNQDHSMLTAMTAVDNIASGRDDKSNVWAVNTEDDYHEERAEPAPSQR
jgi:protoporphyrinogen oxidase